MFLGGEIKMEIEKKEEISPVNIRELIGILTDPVLKKYLFQYRITRLFNYIAVASVMAWGIVLYGVFVCGW